MFEVNTVKGVKTRYRVEGGFSAAINRLPHSDVRPAMKEIMEACDWCRSAYDKKRKGTSAFTNLEKSFIEEYFRKRKINAWTGELINE